MRFTLNGSVVSTDVVGTRRLLDVLREDLHLTGGMTLEAWVKPNTLTGWQTVLEKQGLAGLDYALYASDQAQHVAGFARITGSDRDGREGPSPSPRRSEPSCLLPNWSNRSPRGAMPARPFSSTETEGLLPGEAPRYPPHNSE